MKSLLRHRVGRSQLAASHQNSLSLELLEPRMMLSTVQVIAAGSEGVEQMELQIDGAVVETWTVNDGASTNNFETFSYTSPDTINASQVRIAFTNPVWDPANGIDTNLRVDKIIIDGQLFETEDPSVFSTGTWLPADGITPGFRESEYLHGAGYFQFDGETTGGDGSVVTVRAQGDEGFEQFRLLIDGTAVASFNTTTDFAEYSYTADDTVSADDVRVEFFGAVWDPANGIDSNLNVDYISIDGEVFETEDPSVFSTGTWSPGDGITPGFRLSETLHANGYFQYADETTGGGDGSVVVVRASGDEGFERFSLFIAGSNVASFNTTTDFVDYSYTADSIVSADDIRVQFFNAAWDPVNGIDANLNVDYISIDGQVFETEDPSVFSTGTWLPGDGINLGFRLSETLHANGYFQYADTSLDGGDLQLGSSIYFVGESGSSVVVQIVRENGSDGAVTIEYDTLDSTALAGEDYIAQSGIVSWADGESGIKTVSIPILNDELIEGDEQFSFTIDNPTGPATLLVPRTATITIDDDDSIQGLGDGLLGEYFDNQDLTSRFLFRTDDTIDFDWSNGAPASGMGADTFSVRWTGQIEALYSETYSFQTTSDDGVRLWVDDTLIIDQWNDHSPTVHTGTIDLQAGVLTNIRMEFYDNTGGAVAQLRWTSTSQALEIVPTGQLYAADDPPPIVGSDLVSQTIVTGLPQPTALEWTPDGENMYITLKSGVVRVIHDGVLETTPFIDISAMVNGTRDRGLLDVAVHPDFENNPYVYLLFTYDPPEVAPYTGLAGPDGNGNRAGRLIRVTANAANDYKTAVPGSEVVLLGTNSTWDNFNGFVNSTSDFNEPPAGINPDGSNIQDFIASDSESHTIGSLAFGIDGNLFVSIGDGTSYNAVDPRTVRVQDIDNLSGKVLRIDPITGQGLSDNPFYRGDADENRAKVYQYGLRNPFRMTVDPVSGQLYIGDVGWTQWEEINSGDPGANFGWPYYEGGSGVSLQTNGYSALPEAQVFYASGQTVTPAIYALNHSQSGINAIILGDVYTGSAYPSQYAGDLFFNDLGQGIVRNVSFDAAGNVTNVETFTGGAQIVVHIKQGPDGNLYFIDLNDNKVGRWVFE